MKNLLKMLLLILFTSYWVSAADVSTYDTVVAGKKCKETFSQSISCEFSVGKSLKFSIDGIGDPDTGVSFLKSDIDGDYWATYGVLHGCIIVKAGFKNNGEYFDKGYAFVSPSNGKVYRSWQQCAEGL